MANFDGVDPALLAAYEGLKTACPNLSVPPRGAFRTYQDQVDLNNEFDSGAGGIYMPAEPGTSPHEHGQALDVNGDLVCAQQNAARFGLVFPYGDGKGGGADPPHMILAGGSDHVPQFNGPDGAPRPGAPTAAADPLPAILAGVTAALKRGQPGKDSNIGNLSGLRTAITAGEAPPATASVPGAPGGGGGSTLNPGSGEDVDKFLAAIRQHESGGNYQAGNERGGAYGAYQFIDSTWQGLGGQGRASNAPPEEQDRIAREYAMRLFSQYGNWKQVAMSWYYPAWVDKPEMWNSVPYPSAGNTKTLGQFGDDIVGMMGNY